MKIKSKLKINNEFIETLKRDFFSLLYFEVKFRVITVLLFIPLLTFMADLLAEILGYDYISLDIILNNMENLFVWIFLLIEITLFSVISLIEIFASIVTYYKIDKNGYSLHKIIIYILKNINIKMLLKNSLIIPLTLFMTFFSFFQTTVISRVKMPNFIKETLLSNDFYYLAYYIFIFIVFTIAVFLTFSFNEMFIRKKSVCVAVISSIKLVKKHFLRFFIIIILTINIIYLISYLLSLGMYFIVGILVKIKISQPILWLVSVFRIGIIFFDAIKLILIVTIIRFVIYYFYKKNTADVGVWHNIAPIKREHRQVRRVRIIAIFIVVLLINAVYFNFIVKNDIRLTDNTYVTSHRGGGFYEVENTLSSIKVGADSNADFAEIDIQITKDNNIILLHDNTFKRVYGVDKSPADMDLEEIKQLSVKSKLNKDIKLKVPTLQEAIVQARDAGIKLNIEIKGKKKDFYNTAVRAVEIVKKMNFQKECIFTSLNLDALKVIKKYDDELKTGYILVVAFEDIVNIVGVDYLIVEESIATREFIQQAHKSGKQVHVWTLNDIDKIKKFIELGADNIITDLPDEAYIQKKLYKNYDSLNLRLIRLLN